MASKQTPPVTVDTSKIAEQWARLAEKDRPKGTPVNKGRAEQAAEKDRNTGTPQQTPERKAADRDKNQAVPSYKRGGTKRGKGIARLHRGENIKSRKRGRMRGR